jgi:integrative and conjugative element protein (TIGR02256 family)
MARSASVPRVFGGSETIHFPIGTSGQSLVFSNGVIKHLCRFRQLWWWDREAGGQLFARFTEGSIIVDVATGPRATDRRTRMSYVPDRDAERREIAEFFDQELHFVGEWHSHPERHPVPSALDDRSMAECVRKSDHRLNGFLLVIVGTALPPDGWHVSVHDGSNRYRLHTGRHGAKVDNGE